MAKQHWQRFISELKYVVFLYKQPQYKYLGQDKLSNEIKEKVKVGVNRESPEDKIRDFTKWIDSVKKEVKHLVSMSGSSN